MDLPLKNQTLYLSRSCITSQPELNHETACSWEEAEKCLFWMPCAPKNNPKKMGEMPPARHLASPTLLLVSIQEKPKDSQKAYRNFENGFIFRKYCSVTLFLTDDLWPASSSKPAQRGLVASPGWFTFWKHKIFQNFFINWHEQIFSPFPVRQTDTLTPQDD